MSNWVVISGTLRVEIPFQTVVKERVKDYVDWAIARVKHYGYDITGSERSAEIYVNGQDCYTCWTSECGNSWSIAHIQIVGSLRDRELDYTVDEAKSFLKKFAQFVNICDVNLRISDTLEEKIVTDHYYSKLDKFDDIKSYTANERYRKKLFCIQLHNQHRFFDNLLNFKTCVNIAEIISKASPSAIEGLLSNFDLDRLLSWDFDERIVEWYKKHKIKIPKIEEEHYKRWFADKKRQAKDNQNHSEIH